jgi:hypothetical protein
MCGPKADIIIEDQAQDYDADQLNENRTKRKKRSVGREEHHVIKDIMRALCICHNVTPTYEKLDGKLVRNF